MSFSDEMMNYKGQLKLLLKIYDKGRYLTSELSNIWMNGKVLKHSHLFTSVDWQADTYLTDTYVVYLLRM